MLLRARHGHGGDGRNRNERAGGQKNRTELPPETEEPETEEPGTELPADDVGEPAVESYQLVIEEGDVCDTVCYKLEEDGVIGDAWSFRFIWMKQAMPRISRSGRMRSHMGLQWKK